MVTNEVNQIVTEDLGHKDARMLDLAELDWHALTKFDYKNAPEFISRLTKEYLVPTEQFIFVVPEYNGSFPGILKLFIDLASIVNYNGLFMNSSVHLIGVSDGRTGNLRGLDQLSCILRHMGAKVIYKPMPISSIGKELVDGKLNLGLRKSLKNYLVNLRL